MAETILQLWPPTQAPPSDHANCNAARCRLPDFLFDGPSALQVGDPVLVYLEAGPGSEGQARGPASPDWRATRGSLPIALLCHAYPWPVGECDACCALSVATVASSAPRVPLPPSGVTGVNAPFAVASTTASRASQGHLSQHHSSLATCRASFHRVKVVGDATSVEAAHNPLFSPVTSKSASIGRSDSPPSQSSSQSAAWSRLLKRSLRRTHLATSCAPELPWLPPPFHNRSHSIKSYSNQGDSSSSSGSDVALEVLGTVPRSGWVQSPPLVRGDPVSWTLHAVRVTETTLVTLSTASSLSAANSSHTSTGSSNCDSMKSESVSKSESTAVVEDISSISDNSISDTNSSGDVVRFGCTHGSVVERLWHALAKTSPSSPDQGDGLRPPTQRQGSPLAALEALQSALLLPLWLRAVATTAPDCYPTELYSRSEFKSSSSGSTDAEPAVETPAMTAAAAAVGKAGREPDLSLLPRGLLLSGPPGVGKTFAVQRAVDAVNLVLQPEGPRDGEPQPVLLLVLRGAEVLALGVGDAEAELRRIFAQAHAHCNDSNNSSSSSRSLTSPPSSAAGNSRGTADRRPEVVPRSAVVFFDEVDALCPKRDEQSTNSATVRCVAQLLTLMDGASDDSSNDDDNDDNGSISSGRHPPNGSSYDTNASSRKSKSSTGSRGKRGGRGKVLVIGATNRPDDLDEALRRPGRFDHELVLQPPDEQERKVLLERLLKEAAADSVAHLEKDSSSRSAEAAVEAKAALTLDPKDLSLVAAGTVGYVAADLAALLREAVLQRLLATLNSASSNADTFDGVGHSSHTFTSAAADSSAIVADETATASGVQKTKIDKAEKEEEGAEGEVSSASTTDAPPSLAAALLAARRKVGASGLRHRWVSSPTTQWSDIGGYAGTKQQLQRALEWPQKFRAEYAHLNLSPPRGLLLYGPPGCAKTLLVKAVACSSGATFVSVSSADVYSPMVGDAEASVRRAFTLARRSPPALLFFDEIDALVCDRGTGSGGGSGNASGSVEARVLSTLLNEMDGVASEGGGRDGLLVVAATNRPQALDAALLRPGRFDNAMHVPAPDVDARLAILQVHLRSTPCHADVSLSELATNATAGFTGAEVSACCQEAAFAALREHFQQKGEKGEMEPALTADSGHKKHKERSDGANKVNGEDSDGSEGPVVCMRHLLAAASRTAPLLADPVAAARYADDFSLNK